MAEFNIKRPSIDANDPLLHAVHVIAGTTTPQEAKSKILGDSGKYHLATLAPWADITDNEGADFAAQETLKILRAPNSAGKKILDPQGRSGEVTISTSPRNVLLSRVCPIPPNLTSKSQSRIVREASMESPMTMGR